jgi:hypothetical protein
VHVGKVAGVVGVAIFHRGAAVSSDSGRTATPYTAA